MAKNPSVFVHEHALCESDDVGPRTRIWAFAHVLPGARIGADCNVCDLSSSKAGHWSAAVSPSRTMCSSGTGSRSRTRSSSAQRRVYQRPTPEGRVQKGREAWLATLVRRGATVGANAPVICGVTIGRWAFVGAGAVVIADVPDHALVVGNPARRIGWTCECGERLSDDLACGCGRSYRLTAAGSLEAQSLTSHHDR